MSELAFILDDVNDNALTEALRPSIAGVTGISTIILTEALRIQLADLIASAEVVDEFGDILLLVHYEGAVDENAVSIAVNAHNPATPSMSETLQAVAAEAEAALLAIDWDAELEDIEQGITLVTNQIVNGNPTLAQVRATLGLLLIGNGTTEEGLIRKIRKLGKWQKNVLQMLAKTDDLTVNGS